MTDGKSATSNPRDRLTLGKGPYGGPRWYSSDDAVWKGHRWVDACSCEPEPPQVGVFLVEVPCRGRMVIHDIFTSYVQTHLVLRTGTGWRYLPHEESGKVEPWLRWLAKTGLGSSTHVWCKKCSGRLGTLADLSPTV